MQANVHPALPRLSVTIFWSTLILHILAGAWYYVALNEDGPTWLSETSIDTSSPVSTYIACFYYISSTVVGLGIGDIRPVTDTERIFTTILMLMGLAWCAAFISTVTGVMADLDRVTADARQRMRSLEIFAEQGNLSKDLRQRIFL